MLRCVMPVDFFELRSIMWHKHKMSTAKSLWIAMKHPPAHILSKDGANATEDFIEYKIEMSENDSQKKIRNQFL